MSRIQRAFENQKAFVAFFTAGDPDAQHTVQYVLDAEKAGAAIVQIGIPFSDPTAEGPVVQDANIRALRKGMTTDGVFEIVKNVRAHSDVPIVLYSYLNPVFHCGYETFFKKCADAGVDGIVLPELPFEEKGEVDFIAERHGVDLIAPVVPGDGQRIQKIAREAKGFVLVQPPLGMTDIGKILEVTASAVRAVREAADIPCVAALEACTVREAKSASAVFDGVLAQSAMVRIIEESGNQAGEKLCAYVSGMCASLKS